MDKIIQALSGLKSINWTQARRNTTLLLWTITGILAFSLPLIIWSAKKKEYYNINGYQVEYENRQRYYEEQQENYYKQQQANYYNNNNNYYNAYQANYYDNYGYRYGYGYRQYYKECGWWNFACRAQQRKYASQYMADENDNGEYRFEIPNWFLSMSGQSTEEMRRWREENTGERQEDEEMKPTGGEIMVIVYMFLVFVGVLGYGAYTLYQNKCRSMLKWSLIFLIQLIVVNIFLLPSVIGVDDRMWEESVYGWYGQPGVLMAYFDFWVLIFSVVFLGVFYVQDKTGGGDGGAKGSEGAASAPAEGDDNYRTMI